MFNRELINWSNRLLLISFLILDEWVMESWLLRIYDLFSLLSFFKALCLSLRYFFSLFIYLSRCCFLALIASRGKQMELWSASTQWWMSCLVFSVNPPEFVQLYLVIFYSLLLCLMFSWEESKISLQFRKPFSNVLCSSVSQQILWSFNITDT